MSNKRFLLDFEVEAHGCLHEQIGTVRSVHPNGEFEIHISNLAVKKGTDRPLLSMQIVVPGSDIDEVAELGMKKLREYLRYLTFVTNFSYQIHKLIRIIDWTPGLRERKCIQYEKFSELPYPVLREAHFRSVEILQGAELSTTFQRALTWFSNGVTSEYFEDQFQHFWFVLELLSQLHKDPAKVNDKCPSCKAPLYCQSCATYPLHRPYPKQAIKQLVERIVKDDPVNFFETAYEIRNALMHGDAVEEITKSRNVNFGDIVNAVGRVAWTGILNTFKAAFKESPPAEQLALLQRSMYTHEVLKFSARLIVYSTNPDEPNLAELARPKIELLFAEESETT